MFRKLKKNILSEIVSIILVNIFQNFFKKYNFYNYYFKFIKNNNFVNLENIYTIYANNKKILLNKSDIFFTFLDNQISNLKFDVPELSDLSINLSFLENVDKKYIKKIIKKFERLSLNEYINFMTNDIRIKFIEKFKQIINSILLLYMSFISVLLNYISITKNIRIVRAPPFNYNF